MCPGRRVAEMEMQLLLANVVASFDIGYSPEERADPVWPIQELFLGPQRALKQSFTLRS